MVLIIDDGNLGDLTRLSNALSEIDEETRALMDAQVKGAQKIGGVVQPTDEENDPGPRTIYRLNIT